MAHTKAARELGLSGSDAWVYCALKVLCAKGAWNGSMQQLADESMCGGRMTATRSVDRLIERNIIIRTNEGLQIAQNEQGIAQNEHQNAQNEQNLKEKNQKKNIINKINVVVNNKPQAASNNNDNNNTFFEFWKRYAASGENWDSEKGGTRAFFDKLEKEDQEKAIKRAGNHRKGKSPYFYLYNRDFDVEEPQKELRVLNGIEADMAKAQGVKVVVAQVPDGTFKMVLKQDADAWGLKVVREF